MNEPSEFDVPTKTVDLEVIHDDNGLHTPHAKNHNLYGLQMTQATYEGVKSLERMRDRSFSHELPTPEVSGIPPPGPVTTSLRGSTWKWLFP